MAPRPAIQIRGLVDFRKALGQLNADLPKELGNVNKAVADFVIDRAEGRAQGLGALWARAARSLSSARKQRVAMVRLGGTRYPEALGAEFGAIRNIPRLTTSGRSVRGWNQFREWRGSDTDAGYFLYPTLREDAPEIVEFYADLVERLAKKAFPS